VALAATPALAAASPTLFPSTDFPTPDGPPVTVTCLKHATLHIRYADLEIHVDPVSTGIPPATDYAAYPKADLVLVTHEHFDHFDRAAIDTLTKDGTVLIANPAVHAMLGSGTALANGDRLQLRPDVAIEAVPACNTTPERLKFHPRGRDNGYVLTLGGFRLYVAGDTEDIPEMADLRDIDLAFLPCNLPYTMTPEQTAAAALSFRPKVLVPYHYGATPVRRVADLLAGSGIDVRIPAAP
ncbi:MAG: MBL fold metallo-hydrolase, partial [Kiritimatiellae bacterium]|nr:MBL fold metallo-hydrolase [Kiritimatiellia bacterium]